jgi:hypothetical protein
LASPNSSLIDFGKEEDQSEKIDFAHLSFFRRGGASIHHVDSHHVPRNDLYKFSVTNDPANKHADSDRTGKSFPERRTKDPGNIRIAK